MTNINAYTSTARPTMKSFACNGVYHPMNAENIRHITNNSDFASTSALPFAEFHLYTFHNFVPTLEKNPKETSVFITNDIYG